MELALGGLVAVPADQHHADQRRHERNRRVEADRDARAGGVLQHPRQPQEDAVGHRRVQQVDERQQPDAAASQAAQHAAVPRLQPLRAFRAHRRRQPLAVVGRQPVGLFRPIGQHPQRQESENHRGQPFEQEQPLPAAQSEHAVHAQDRFRHRRADDHRHGRRHHEQRIGARALGRGHPVGEVEHHAGEESRLGDAQHDARDHERRHVADEHRRHRHEAPADHDARDPAAGADAIEDQIAGNLEQAVAEKEQPGAEPVFGGAQAEILLQLPRREPDVDAVDVGDHVADEGERDNAAVDAGNHRRAAGVVGCRGQAARR